MIAGLSLIFFDAPEISSIYEPFQKNFWFQTDLKREHLANFYKQGSQLPFSWRQKNFGFAHHGHVLITLNVSFLFPIDQNLTGEFKRKMYAASGNLFTDSWSWESHILCF